MKKRNVKKITLINIISNIILQIANIFSWFIIPKIILTYFGSDVNGLVSSITQFLSYITLIEGGVTGVVMASLYKPLVNNDNKKISAIIKTSLFFIFFIDKPLQIDTAKASIANPTPISKSVKNITINTISSDSIFKMRLHVCSYPVLHT